MKRRIIVLCVMVLSVFALTQSNSVARSASNSDSIATSDSCEWECTVNAEACYRQCDMEYEGSPTPNPWWLMQCYDFCRWQEETCYWTC